MKFDEELELICDFEGCIDDECKRVAENVKRLPVSYYSEIFNPLNVPTEEPVIGELQDDLIAIYSDTVRSLRQYQEGDVDSANWHWAFSFNSHWGEHATGALRALHM